MATDVERLLVRLEADITKYERAMNRASGITTQQARQIEANMRQIERNMSGGLASAAGRFAGIFAAAFSVDQVRQYADSYIRVQNSLKVAGLQGEDLKNTYTALYEISQRQGVSLESTAQLYGRLSSAQKDLNASNGELLKFTEGVGQALRVAGTDATQAAGALLQLGQAVSGGKVQAEEYNSILDGARPVLQTVANGLKEAGGSVSKLTALVKEGEVSSQAFFRAFLAGAPQLAQQADQAESTSSAAFTRLKNSLINLVGQTDKTVGATSAITGGMSSLAGAVDSVTVSLNKALAALIEFNKQGGEKLKTSLDAAKRGTAGVEASAIQAQIDSLKRQWGGNVPAGSGDALRLKGLEAQLAQAQLNQRVYENVPGSEDRIGRGLSRPVMSAIEPVSTADFPVTAAEKKTKTGKSTDEVKSFADQLNKTIDPTIEYNRQIDLLNQAIERNLIASDKQAEAIKLIRERTIEAKDGNKELENMARGIESAIQSVGSKFGDTLGDLVTGGKVNFKDLADSIIKDLVRIATQIMLIQPLIEAMKAGSSAAGGGFDIVGLIGGLFGGGRAEGGPISAGTTYLVGERGPELVRFGSSGMVIPNKAIGAGRSASTVVNMGDTVIDARGAQIGVADQIAAAVSANNKVWERRLPQILARSQARYA